MTLCCVVVWRYLCYCTYIGAPCKALVHLQDSCDDAGLWVEACAHLTLLSKVFGSNSAFVLQSQPPPVYPSWQEGQGSAARYDDSGDRGLLSNVLGGSTSGACTVYFRIHHSYLS